MQAGGVYVLGSVYPVLWLGVLRVIDLFGWVDRWGEVLKNASAFLLLSINEDLIAVQRTKTMLTIRLNNCITAEDKLLPA